jgi:2-oxoglutarate ferredoxin oxidoreductase subunit beta
MVDVNAFGEYETAWCPGCGNFRILKCLKQALAELDLPPSKVCMVSGIGQAAKSPHYLNCNCFNGLHGRGLPAAQGAHIANPDMTVICESGDGCHYGEGGNHFLGAIRRNMNITMFAHDNQIYGLTKGQASPTTEQGHKTKAQPYGAPSTAFNPLAVGISLGISFVARGFCGDEEFLVQLMKKAITHKGFALLDIFQNCVSFNKVNTFGWYKDRVYRLEDHDPTDRAAALEKAFEFGDKIPTGVIYTNDRPTFEDQLPTFSGKPLADAKLDKTLVREAMKSFA